MTAGQHRLFSVAQEQLTSDDHYTPAWVFERMGIEFDIDVCAPPGGVPWIPAKRYLTQADDGLLADWGGQRVWMNPPFSRTSPWSRKFIANANGIALVPHSKSASHLEVMKSDAAICAPSDGYFDFTGGPIFMPVFFAAFGDECVDAISRLGVVRRIA